VEGKEVKEKVRQDNRMNRMKMQRSEVGDQRSETKGLYRKDLTSDF
jgi:hypothetical protein